MDLDSQVNGGVLILHKIHEGKHQYEVEKVVRSKKENRTKMFARRGDKLMQINGIDLQDLTPEELAQMLAEGNPMLTVHKAGRMKEQTEQPPPDEDALHPVSKESTTLNFHWEMRREEDLENEVEKEGGKGKETGAAEEDVIPTQNEEDEEEERDLLIVTMTKTSISVLRGRGCDSGGPCQGCGRMGCTFNDVVVVSETSTVTLVPRGSGSFRQEKLSNVLIEHVDSHLYLRGQCSQKRLYVSPNPEKITIYYYKSNVMDSRTFPGVPVVLNLTGTNCFLKCCKDGTSVVLQVETCEQQRLRHISKSDQNALAFLFYMKSDKTKQRKFESVLHNGWFIHIATDPECVEMATLDGGLEEHSFLFVIQK